METGRSFRIDLTKIRGRGDFKCPRCGVKISPDDETEKTYRILEALVRENELHGIMLQCNKCATQIHLTGFHSLSMNR